MLLLVTELILVARSARPVDLDGVIVMKITRVRLNDQRKDDFGQ